MVRLRTKRVFLILWLMISGCATDPALVHVNQGDVLRRNGHFDSAIVEYHAALRITPDNIAAHNNLGLALAAKGDLEGAITEYRAALRLAPKMIEAHVNL